MHYQFSKKIDSLQPPAIREILKASCRPFGHFFSAAGNPAPEAFPIEAVQKITREILEENPILALQYSVNGRASALAGPSGSFGERALWHRSGF